MMTASPKPMIGTVRVPGDKSLSHRAILLAACASDEDYSVISGVPQSSDVLSTINAVTQLGAEVIQEVVPPEEGLDAVSSSLTLRIKGWGTKGPLNNSELDSPIDCGNSATLARLLMGLLMGYPGSYTLIGDSSLVTRPMERVTNPLRLMGAQFNFLEVKNRLPLTMEAPQKIDPITYEMKIASAQVKSALLFAGMFAEGATQVSEPYRSRDHTENLLSFLGADVTKRSPLVIRGPFRPTPFVYSVPGDPSSAAFFAAAAALIPGSDLRLQGMGLNQARIAFFDVLKHMGVGVEIESAFSLPAIKEPFGNVRVYLPQDSPPLKAVDIPALTIPMLIDELPVFSLLAANAVGKSVVKGMGELRIKETNRAQGILDYLALLGVESWLDGDDLHIVGKGPIFSQDTLCFDSKGDHRMALLALVVKRCIAPNARIINGDCTNISYPDFNNFMSEM